MFYSDEEWEKKKNEEKRIATVLRKDEKPQPQTNVHVEVQSGNSFLSGLQFGFGCIFAGIVFMVVLAFLCTAPLR